MSVLLAAIYMEIFKSQISYLFLFCFLHCSETIKSLIFFFLKLYFSITAFSSLKCCLGTSRDITGNRDNRYRNADALKSA